MSIKDPKVLKVLKVFKVLKTLNSAMLLVKMAYILAFWSTDEVLVRQKCLTLQSKNAYADVRFSYGNNS